MRQLRNGSQLVAAAPLHLTRLEYIILQCQQQPDGLECKRFQETARMEQVVQDLTEEADQQTKMDTQFAAQMEQMLQEQVGPLANQ